MFRSIIIFFKIGLLTALAIWLVNNTGRVEITLSDYSIETSLSVVVLGLLILATLIYFIRNFIKKIFNTKERVSDFFYNRKQRVAYKALLSSLSFIETGDTDNKIINIEKVKDFYNGKELFDYFKAKLCLLLGDNSGAEYYYKKLLEVSEAKFLALYGLIRINQRKEDYKSALLLADDAYKIQPSSFWLLETLFNLLVKNECFQRAQIILSKMHNLNYLTKDQLNTKSALLWVDYTKKIKEYTLQEKYLKKAYGIAPKLYEVVIPYVNCLNNLGKKKYADKILKKIWIISPNYKVVDTFVNINKSIDSVQLAKKVADFCKLVPENKDIHLILARVYLDAKLWGKTRVQLKKFKPEELTIKICRMFAELEISENKNYSAANKWLERAVNAFQS